MKQVSSFFEFQLEGIKAALMEVEIEFEAKPRQVGFDLYVDEAVYEVALALCMSVENHQVNTENFKIHRLAEIRNRSK